MPVTILPSPLRGLSESIGEGLRIGQRGRRLSQIDRQIALDEERAKEEAIRRRLEMELAQAKEGRAAQQFQGQQAALGEIAQRRAPPPPAGQLFTPPPPGPPTVEQALTTPELRARAGIGAKIPAPTPTDKRLTPLQKIEQGRLLLDKDRGAGIDLLNAGLADSGSTYRIPKKTESQVVRGLADLFIDYNTATEDIDFNLPSNAAVLDKIESGLLKDLVKSESFQRATPAGQTDISKAADKFFQAKRKMRQKSLTTRETILGKVVAGENLTAGERKIYNEVIKKKDPLTPEDVEARTTARLRAYREEKKKAIESDDLDGMASLISSAEEKLMGRSDPEVVEKLVWATFEAHYRTKKKKNVSPDEFDRRTNELMDKFGYNRETAVRLLRLKFKVVQ